MSDPVTNVEIEDVLSSIRRLVSDGDKSRARDSNAETEAEGTAEAAPDAPDGEATTPDRLVLTPAFRVAEDDDVAPSPAEDASVDVAASPATVDEDHQDDDQAGEIAEVAASAELLWETPRASAAQQAPETDNAATPDSVETADPPDRSTLEATIAELEAAVGPDDDFEPDNGSEEIEAVVWPGSTSRVRADTTDAQDVSDIPFQHHRDEDDYASEDVDLSSDDDDAVLNAYLDDDGMMDEDMLRDLVTDIVRQELQGTMGERITRNVRKLVRREIHRILSSQDFD